MHVTNITTHISARYPHLMWVEIETADGFRGLGETYYWPGACAEYIHEAIAPILLKPRRYDIETLVQLFLRTRLTSARMSIETRGFSAVETALIDIEAQRRKQSLVDFLGGPVRDSVRVYNTGGSRYAGDELVDFVAGLHAQGINAFKVMPYHRYVEKTGGQSISRGDLTEARQTLNDIRGAIGDQGDIMIEMGCRWQPYGARQICTSLRDLDLMWIEDPVVIDCPKTLGALRAEAATPFAVSEYLSTINGLLPYYDAGAVDVVMIDVSWVGGVLEAKKVAAIAESRKRPVTFHDFTGPLAYILGSHMSLNVPNVLIQESATDFYSTWYLDVVSALPQLAGGQLTPPPGIGIGAVLNEKFRTDPSTQTRTSTATSEASAWAVMDALGKVYAQSNLLHLNAE